MPRSFQFLPTCLTISAAWILASCSSSPVNTVNIQPTTPTYSNIPSNVAPVGAPLRFDFVHVPAGSNTQYRVVAMQNLPGWAAQHFVGSLQSFKNGCAKLMAQSDWQYACARAMQTPMNHVAAKQFFEQVFTAWQVSENGQLAGMVTGYYEPIINGDIRLTATARFPIYGIPSDFISVAVPVTLRNSDSRVRMSLVQNGRGVIQSNGNYVIDLARFPNGVSTLSGRLQNGELVPYFTQAQINAGVLNDGRAPILGYANDPIELAFMQIQGSGRLRLPSGQLMRLAYAGNNGYAYKSIGRYMADQNYLPLAQTSMQGIKAWLAQHPQKLYEILASNPRYIFFRRPAGSPNDGPIGALGVPLLGEFAGAVDKRYITLGAPIFVATAHPNAPQIGLNRLIMAQDTGNAIRGAVRVDYFWGSGDAAGAVAGKQKHRGYVWQLLPNGVLPAYRP